MIACLHNHNYFCQDGNLMMPNWECMLSVGASLLIPAHFATMTTCHQPTTALQLTYTNYFFLATKAGQNSVLFICVRLFLATDTHLSAAIRLTTLHCTWWTVAVSTVLFSLYVLLTSVMPGQSSLHSLGTKDSLVQYNIVLHNLL